jgi:hypothetical protein
MHLKGDETFLLDLHTQHLNLMFFDGLTDHITEHVFSRQDYRIHKVAMRSLLGLIRLFSPANSV